jgi:hypothetical protein
VLAWLPAGGGNGTVGNGTDRAGYPSTAAESSSLSSFAHQPSRGMWRMRAVSAVITRAIPARRAHEPSTSARIATGEPRDHRRGALTHIHIQKKKKIQRGKKKKKKKYNEIATLV